MTDAHDQKAVESYVEHWPAHPPREHDPHKHLFDAYHRAHKDTATCWVGDRIGPDHCAPKPYELHHAHLEESAQNAAVAEAVRRDYPQVHDAESLALWVNGGLGTENFRWLCSWHHRSMAAGAHHVTHSDWEVGAYSPTFLTQYDDAQRLIRAANEKGTT